MDNKHPFIKYAQALLMHVHALSSHKEVTKDIVADEIEKSLTQFRLKAKPFEGKDKVSYDYCREAKGDASIGLFLAPNVISSDKLAGNIWKEANELIVELRMGDPDKIGEMKMSIAPVSNEFLSFAEKIGRGKSKGTNLEQGLSAVTSLTTVKPCLQYRIDKKSRPDMFNVCVIPDLPLNKLVLFIAIFERMLTTQTGNLKEGNVTLEVKGKGTTEKKIYSPKRPLIYKGNFPNAPRSSVLGSVALLGALGEFAKEAEFSKQTMLVLDSLKDTTMYMIKYGGASTFTYNHHVVDLAKEGKLKDVVDGLYYSRLYNQDKRSSLNTEYQKFDLFASRFLQLFTHAAFKDFLLFRAEYQSSVITLLNIYFIKMETIDPKIVASARTLGKWLNLVAYQVAKSEVEDKLGKPQYYEDLRKAKVKVLVELESSTFSAKRGDALIAQAVTRAGRLSGFDAPEGAALFMETTFSGELALDQAKNLLIAFSRLKNTKELKEIPKNEIVDNVDDEKETDA